MSCGYCKKKHSLLSGEDWNVFIRGNRLIATVAGDVHDYKEIKVCPMCSESLLRPTPLGLEQLKKMNNERVFIMFDEDVCIPALVAYHAEACDNEDGDEVYLTNNLGGRSTYEEIVDMGAEIYTHRPGQKP